MARIRVFVSDCHRFSVRKEGEDYICTKPGCGRKCTPIEVGHIHFPKFNDLPDFTESAN